MRSLFKSSHLNWYILIYLHMLTFYLKSEVVLRVLKILVEGNIATFPSNNHLFLIGV